MIRLPARWAELAATDFADEAVRRAVAILPVGAIEQHGPHLPLATDAIISQGIVDTALTRLASGTPAVVLPAQEIGTSPEHLAFGGTLSFDAASLIRTWTQVAEGVHRAGLRKLVIFNSHGGQAGVPELVAADLRARLGMIVSWASPGAFGTPDGLIDPHEAVHGLHGGLKETAMLLHLRPDLVRRDAIRNFASIGETMARNFDQLRASGRVGFGWQAQDLNPAGVVGNAEAATPELGGRLIEHAAQGLAQLIGDMLRFELP
ncbi:MAG TPA: creatininase family protein [Alphaproteobacteria bacterium]|nr:creatininase family protein [Alphaproteobacteria bacterium]